MSNHRYMTIMLLGHRPSMTKQVNPDIDSEFRTQIIFLGQAQNPSRPPLPPRNKNFNLPRSSRDCDISPESSLLNQEIVRVTSNMDTNSQSCQSDKTENSKGSKTDKKCDKSDKAKDDTSPKKLKRLISDPVTLKNPFNPIASDGNSKFFKGSALNSKIP